MAHISRCGVRIIAALLLATGVRREPFELAAQSAGPPPRACDHVSSLPDSITLPLYLNVVPHMPGTLTVPKLSREQRAELHAFAVRLQQAFVMPRPVPFTTPLLGPGFDPLPKRLQTARINSIRSVGSRLRFGSPDQSTLVATDFESNASAPALDSAILHAVKNVRADPQLDLPHLRQYLQFDVYLDFEHGIEKESASSGVPLDSLRVPAAQTSSVRPLPGNKPPRYPEFLKLQGVSGEVLLRYVVDSAGRVDPQSVTVPSATNATFLASVREQMSAWRFAPATVNGCAVSQLVVQPFTFAIAK